MVSKTKKKPTSKPTDLKFVIKYITNFEAKQIAHSVDDVISMFQLMKDRYLEKGLKDIEIQYIPSYHGCRFEVYGTRLETIKEAQQREANERRERRLAKHLAKVAHENIAISERAEKELFLSLKKKFEPS